MSWVVQNFPCSRFHCPQLVRDFSDGNFLRSLHVSGSFDVRIAVFCDAPSPWHAPRGGGTTIEPPYRCHRCRDLSREELTPSTTNVLPLPGRAATLRTATRGAREI